MNKDKIIFADGTEIILDSSLGIGALHTLADSKAAALNVWEKLTSDNLAKVTVKNADDMTIGVYDDMVLDHIEGRNNPDGTVQFTVSLRSKTTEELLTDRIGALESGQQTQDEAIGDLGQAVSDIVEGGTQ